MTIQIKPKRVQYVFTEKQLVSEVQKILKNKFKFKVEIEIINWEDGDFTFCLGENEHLSEKQWEDLHEEYPFESGGETTPILLRELFEVPDAGYFDIQWYTDKGEYQVNVDFDSVQKNIFPLIHEAWAQAEELTQTLDMCGYHTTESVEIEKDVYESMKKRAKIIMECTSDFTPDNMTDYEAE